MPRLLRRQLGRTPLTSASWDRDGAIGPGGGLAAVEADQLGNLVRLVHLHVVTGSGEQVKLDSLIDWSPLGHDRRVDAFNPYPSLVEADPHPDPRGRAAARLHSVPTVRARLGTLSQRRDGQRPR